MVKECLLYLFSHDGINGFTPFLLKTRKLKLKKIQLLKYSVLIENLRYTKANRSVENCHWKNSLSSTRHIQQRHAGHMLQHQLNRSQKHGTIYKDFQILYNRQHKTMTTQRWETNRQASQLVSFHAKGRFIGESTVRTNVYKVQKFH